MKAALIAALGSSSPKNAGQKTKVENTSNTTAREVRTMGTSSEVCVLPVTIVRDTFAHKISDWRLEQSQKAAFNDQLARAKLDASDQKAQFDSQLAKAALDIADQKAQFDSQMAKAMLDASHMKVGPQLQAMHLQCLGVGRA